MPIVGLAFTQAPATATEGEPPVTVPEIEPGVAAPAGAPDVTRAPAINVPTARRQTTDARPSDARETQVLLRVIISPLTFLANDSAISH